MNDFDKNGYILCRNVLDKKTLNYIASEFENL